MKLRPPPAPPPPSGHRAGLFGFLHPAAGLLATPAFQPAARAPRVYPSLSGA